MVEIVWSASAINERNAIFHYWNHRNKSTMYSKKLRGLINSAIIEISNMPTIERPTNRPDTRFKVVRDYFIVYRITETVIRIIAFWDCRQNPEILDTIIG